MKLPLCTVLLSFSVLTACGNDSNEAPELGAVAENALELPTSPHDRVQIDGKMTFWMYEGSAGCYGSVEKNGQEVQLWVDADTCGDVDYEENQQVSIKVTYNPDNQYGPGDTYTVVQF